MEEVQTDTLSNYEKNHNQKDENQSLEKKCDYNPENDASVTDNLENGTDDIDQLDLMDAENCENESFEDNNSDVWKGSDSEDESFENRDQQLPADTEGKADQNVDEEQSLSTNESSGNHSKSVDEVQNTRDEKVDAESTPADCNDKIDTVAADDSLKNKSEETQKDDDKPGDKGEDEKSLNQIEDENEKSTSEDGDENVKSPSQGEGENEEPATEMIEGENEKSANKDESKNEKPTENAGENEKSTNKDENANGKSTNNDEDENDKPNNVDKEASEKSTNKNQGENEKLSNSDNAVDKSKAVESTDNDEVIDLDKSDSEEPKTGEEAKEDKTNRDNAGDGGKEDVPTSAEQPPVEAQLNDKGAPTESRAPSEDQPQQEGDDYDEDMDYGDDFDPSLLCPEVSMAVDEDPLITTGGCIPNDGSSSPLPYEPLFSTFVDEVTGAEVSFNLTAEEQELRRRIYGPTNPVQCTKLHCTACNVHLGSALQGQNNRFVHPLLKVLICKECYHFYTSGEFEKDEDGSELYCRWCGQGGQVLCCSKCEYVFCKKCIRNNFGRKKLLEVRDSDSWDCFRCNPSQIILQRVACFEFFEYVRREMSRASTLNDPSFLSKDHTICCNPIKKLPPIEGEVEKKKRKRKSKTDPDYNPLLDRLEQKGEPLGQVSTGQPGQPSVSMLPDAVTIAPKFGMGAQQKDGDIEFVGHIKPNTPQFVINPIRPQMTPMFQKIAPNSIRPAPPAFVRVTQPAPRPVPPLVTTRPPNMLQPRSAQISNPVMKHEWFEKTVRAAARVNSHLSYTLTQLNKAQAQASCVEELAVVHNKLQEILSSSINSLIQIRKNLRTEFIAGIKTVKFPPKNAAETFANDDDVIFVSAPSLPQTASNSVILVNPQLNATQTFSPPSASTSTPNSVNNSGEKPRTYLKVKSVSELQNVPSECITIPDDPPPVAKNDNRDAKETTTNAVCNGVPPADKNENANKKDDKANESGEKTEDNSEKPKENGETCREANENTNKDSEKSKENSETVKENNAKTKEKADDDKENTENTDANKEKDANDKSSEKEKSKRSEEEKSKRSEDKTEKEGKKSDTEDVAAKRALRKRKHDTISEASSFHYKITDNPSPEIKRMLSVRVNIKQMDSELFKRKRLANGRQ